MALAHWAVAEGTAPAAGGAPPAAGGASPATGGAPPAAGGAPSAGGEEPAGCSRLRALNFSLQVNVGQQWGNFLLRSTSRV